MKRFFTTLISLAVICTVFAGSHAAAQGAFTDVCKSKPNASVCQQALKAQDPNGKNVLYGQGSLLAKVASLAALAVGVVSVIMIIIGGLKFVLSGGDSNSVNSARSTILYAIIGLILAVFAETIVVFVINKL